MDNDTKGTLSPGRTGAGKDCSIKGSAESKVKSLHDTRAATASLQSRHDKHPLKVGTSNKA